MCINAFWHFADGYGAYCDLSIKTQVQCGFSLLCMDMLVLLLLYFDVRMAFSVGIKCIFLTMPILLFFSFISS